MIIYEDGSCRTRSIYKDIVCIKTAKAFYCGMCRVRVYVLNIAIVGRDTLEPWPRAVHDLSDMHVSLLADPSMQRSDQIVKLTNNEM